MSLIKRHDGTTYDLLDYGIRTRDLLISSGTPEHNFDKVEGAKGLIDKGTTYGPKNITALFRAQSHDIKDFSLLRDEIFHLLRTEESFYLYEKRQQGKRYLVKVADPFQIPQRNVFGNFEINFIGFTGLAESAGTTQDIHNRGINADDELWGFGLGLIADDDSLKYTHTGTKFKIFNAGNEPIHPFEQDLKITITDVVGSSSHLELRNITNGTIFRVKEAVSNNQRIVIDGADIKSNGLAFLRNTNRKYIELEPGWNEFEIRGASRATVAFDFRFYYK